MRSTPTKATFLSWLFDLLCLTVLLSLFYMIWIGSYPLFTPDEGRYSEVAREMLVTHDFITPRLNGVVFLDKPILYYWLQASAIYLFGLKEWALRFWPAFLGILGCLMVYLTGHYIFNRRTGLLAALLLATAPLFYGAAHYANLDIEVAIFISNALLAFIMAMRMPLGRMRTGTLYTAYFFAALSVLTKGLIGIVFPMLIIGSWIFILGRFRLLLHMRIFSGLLLFLCISLPWYFLVQKANPQFFHFFFITQQFSRFLTHGVYNNQSVLWFYLPILLIGFLPWSFFIIQTAWFHIKNSWQDRKKHDVECFLLLWFMIIFIFFSVPKSKTIGYILPVFPAMALLTANYLTTYWQQVTSMSIKMGVYAFVIMGFITAGIGMWLSQKGTTELIQNLSTHLMILSIGCILFASIVSFIIIKTKKLAHVVYCLMFFAVFLLLIVIKSAAIINERTVAPLTTLLNKQIKPTDEVVSYYRYYQDLSIYLKRRITIVADWHATDIIQKDNWQRELWFGMPFQDTSDWLIEGPLFLQRWNSPKRLFVFMHRSFYTEFEKQLAALGPASKKIYEVGEYKNILLLSNEK